MGEAFQKLKEMKLLFSLKQNEATKTWGIFPEPFKKTNSKWTWLSVF